VTVTPAVSDNSMFVPETPTTAVGTASRKGDGPSHRHHGVQHLFVPGLRVLAVIAAGQGDGGLDLA
jgi:hypothetical protein